MPARGDDAELVRRAYRALNERDAETLLEITTADLEFVSVLSEMEGEQAVFRGPDGVRAYLDTVAEVWTSWQWDVLGVDALDASRVLAEVAFSAHGRGSDVPVRAELAVIATIRDGLVSRVAAYASRDDALAAARSG